MLPPPHHRVVETMWLMQPHLQTREVTKLRGRRRLAMRIAMLPGTQKEGMLSAAATPRLAPRPLRPRLPSTTPQLQMQVRAA